MQKLLIAAAMIVVPATAFAQSSDDQAISLTATVGDACIIPAASQGPITLSDPIADGTTAEAIEAVETITIDDAYCNAAGATVTVASANGGLTVNNGALVTVDGDFDQRVNYGVEMSWGATTFTNVTTLETDGDIATPAADGDTFTTTGSSQPVNGDMTLVLTTDDPATDFPLVEGTYTDTITVTIDLP